MHPYGLERLAVDRQAELRDEALSSALQARRLSMWSAATLRAVADWLDGGSRQDAPVIRPRRNVARHEG
jgi:hypothetical protein